MTSSRPKTCPSGAHERFSDEADPVIAYIFGCFIEDGFDPADAERLARSRVDHHYVEDRLLSRGCSLELALKIAL